MARGHELAGESAKARKMFEDFFALWKEANNDLPALRQAEVEYKRPRLPGSHHVDRGPSLSRAKVVGAWAVLSSLVFSKYFY